MADVTSGADGLYCDSVNTFGDAGGGRPSRRSVRELQAQASGLWDHDGSDPIGVSDPTVHRGWPSTAEPADVQIADVPASTSGPAQT
jgi:hypothetical protein